MKPSQLLRSLRKCTSALPLSTAHSFSSFKSLSKFFVVQKKFDKTSSEVKIKSSVSAMFINTVTRNIKTATLITTVTKKYPKVLFLTVIIGGSIVIVYSLKNKINFFTLCKEEDGTEDVPVNSITPLELLPKVHQKMKPWTWPKGYPVPVGGLAYIKVLYWGFDDQPHVGGLVVNKKSASEVLEVFCELYEGKFPIEQMRLMYEFNNDDDLSMEANNTSAFNCREVTGQPGIFSQHAYGRAVDLNPKINPYVKGGIVLPKGSEKFVDRSIPAKGKITTTSLPFLAFTQRGWDPGWWNDVQDYQHFEKRENGQKRDPDGYGKNKEGTMHTICPKSDKI